MTAYLLKILALLIGSNIVIFMYYFIVPGHTESFNGYSPYLIGAAIVYAVYKSSTLFLSRNPKTLVLHPSSLFYFFLVQLLLLSCFFFMSNGLPYMDGISLIVFIIAYSLLPVGILVGSYVFGDTLLQNISDHDKTTRIFQFLSGLGLGFFLFMFLLTCTGLFGFYTIYSVCILLVMFCVIGHKSLWKFGIFFFSYELSFKNETTKPAGMYLQSSEFLFFVLTLLIATNLISIMRPMPIGWDDLGVYMNHPNLMAQAESLLSLGGMYSWQVFTGIGYLAGSATQAFFFNSIGGGMSVLVVYLMIKDLLAGQKKTLINIPLLMATLFAAMPMVIFQLAKDMKLDPGLLFISAIAVYLVYNLLLSCNLSKKISRNNMCYIFLIGLLIGFSFTIKFTSLLLLSGILGVIFYSYLGWKGFLGYLSIYIAFFTKFGLWSYMNISYPQDKPLLINGFSIGIFLLGIVFLIPVILGMKKSTIQRFVSLICIICVGFFLALTPWLGKNLSEIDGRLSVGNILGGKSDVLEVDYKKIHSKEEIGEIKAATFRNLTSTGTTANEDWGRYFGYEKGINNYVKLPLNLTMQKNQGGEFTDIGYLYLALVPLIFLFLPYRKKAHAFIGYALVGTAYLLLVAFPTFSGLGNLLSDITLPFGYICILFLFLTWLIFLVLLDSKKKYIDLFKINIVFTLFYTFLWSISAYGVVWYGIVMYVGFLLMIAISLYYISSYDETYSAKKMQVKLFGSGVVFLIIIFYFIMSSVPHAFTNIKNASYASYKNGQISAHESVFNYQNGYIEAIYAMNIDDSKQTLLFDDSIEGEKRNNYIVNLENKNILNVVSNLQEIEKTTQINDPQMQLQAQKSIKQLFENILTPKEAYKSKKKIYRIGTFLKYYISENNVRLLEDSLIFAFNDYIYNVDPQTTFNNMRNIGLDLLLVDLNAATIDKDERRNLTQRYEKLLDLFKEDNIQLISTDSVCLKLAIAEYKHSSKTQSDREVFMQLGGVNYDSYLDGKATKGRKQKLGFCYTQIMKILESNPEQMKKYPFLLPLKNYFSTPEGQKIRGDTATLIPFLSQYIPSGRFALFQIK